MSDSKHWAQISEAGSIWGMKFMLGVHQLFGRRMFSVLLLPVISYFYLTRHQSRRISKEYLAHISGFSGQPQASSFKHFLLFGDVLLDKLLAWMGRLKKDDIVIATPEIFDHIVAQKKGAVIIVSHLGNSEICGGLLRYYPDIRITALVYTQHSDKFNALMKQTNTVSNRLTLLQVTDVTPATAMILAERVEAGELIIIAGDRTPVTGTARTSKVNFLGTPAQMPQGAFILAGLLKVPVYLLFAIKEQRKYHIYSEFFAEQLTLPRKSRHEALDGYVQGYAQRLEHYCLKAPLQWFNFYSFWNADNRDQS